MTFDNPRYYYFNSGTLLLLNKVSDLEKAIDIIKKQGIRLLNETPKIGAHGKPVVFLHPKDCNGILTELEQE